LAYYLNSYYTGRLIGYPLREQVADLLPYLGMATVMGVVVYSLQWFRFLNDYTLLISQVLVGMFIYATMSWTFRMPAFVEVIDISRGKLKLCKLWLCKN